MTGALECDGICEMIMLISSHVITEHTIIQKEELAEVVCRIQHTMVFIMYNMEYLFSARFIASGDKMTQ